MRKLRSAWSLMTDVEFAQLEPGEPTVYSELLPLGNLTLGYQRFGAAFSIKGRLQPGKLMVVATADAASRLYWSGVPIGYADAAGTTSALDICTRGPAALFTAVLDRTDEIPSRLAPFGVLHDRNRAQRIRMALRNAVAASRNQCDALFARFVQAEVVSSIRAVFDPKGASAGEARAITRRVGAVRRCETYLREHGEGNPSLKELSELCGLRPRSLYNAFQAVTGLSPMSYLRRLRLNDVRRALQRSDALGRRIVDIAADSGFWHMGHFTADYRALFGELPTATVRSVRRPA